MTDATVSAPLQLTTAPSGSPSWSPSTPCYALNTLFSPVSTHTQPHTPSDPSLYKLHNFSKGNSHSQLLSSAQQYPQIKLSPLSTQQHQEQMSLTPQLDYYRQLQIMHCQRERDIEQLYRQHQLFQLQQRQDRPPSHAIQRGLLAQRMLQLQRLFQAQQIQKMQAMHKQGRADAPFPSPSHSPSISEDSRLIGNSVDESRAQHPSTIMFSATDEHGLAERSNNSNTILLTRSTSNTKRTSIPELAKIVLPSPDQIRKQRQQRLKYKARLRQAATAAAAAKVLVSPTPKELATASALMSMSMPVSPPASPSLHCSPEFTSPPAITTAVIPHSPCLSGVTTVTAAEEPLTPVTPTGMTATPKDCINAASFPGVPKIQPAAWTSSTTSLVPRSKADLHYRRQLRNRLAIQQHLIQDHTHRYRLFQAFCLLQRAQAAQALEESQTQRQRQLHTIAWVQAQRQLQSSAQLEIPQ
ncbi:hypothetical protein FBU30_001524 [Linnemannia zychae]|nr:hypothetical protein FBU30_001524 [Linnemannia zychae]